MLTVQSPPSLIDEENIAPERTDSMSSGTCNQLEPEHLNAIEDIADEESFPIEEIHSLYAAALEDLKSKAVIQEYLIVLTCKKVRHMIRHSRKKSLLLASIPKTSKN